MNDAALHSNLSVLKILTVDDSPSDRAIFRRFLSQNSEQKYLFSESETVADALAEIEKQIPDCILLDYDLPDYKGTDLLREMNRIYGQNKIPVVMLSGSGNIEIAVEVMSEGAQDYLVKSGATPADLMRAVSNAIEKVRLIKEKEAAAEKMQISEERYRLLFDNTPLPAIVFDRQTLVALAVNDYAILHYGYTRNEFLLLSLHELDAFEGASNEIVIGEFCTAKGEIRSISARHRKKDGSVIDVEVNCHDISFKGREARFVIVQDVTERRESEAKLRQSEEFNRTVIESSPDCVKLLDRDGRLQFMNENGLCLMEIEDFDKFKNRDWNTLWADEWCEVVQKTVEMAQRGETGRFEGFCPTAKGNPKWWDVIVTPVRDEQGNVGQILSVSRDITESKQIEQERERNLILEKELRTEAESANRAKDEFLAVLSHELRTPLNAMYGWSKMLSQGGMEESKVRKAVEVIERNLRLQNNLIDDLLDVSRIISGKIKIEPANINICKLVKESVEAARFSAEGKKIEIVPHFDFEECRINADAFRIQQIINNLLTNAIKFTPEGGKINVSLKIDERRVKITVEDTGIGIEQELLPHIFERFKQADGSTKRKFGGLGLGLAIAKSLTEMHHGMITAQSGGIGQGASFIIDLPVVQTSESTHNADDANSLNNRKNSEKPLNGLKIAAVDDDKDSLELLKFVLESHGADFYGFSSATEVLKNLDNLSPDLLISDISMAEMDGFDLIQKVRELPSAKDRFLPAIAMTAYTSIEDRAAVLSAGFQMHVAKPVDISTISSQIREMLDTIQH